VVLVDEVAGAVIAVVVNGDGDGGYEPVRGDQALA
jgi:hypothetical protein